MARFIDQLRRCASGIRRGSGGSKSCSFEDAHVFVADDLVNKLPGTEERTADKLGRLCPPFYRMWVEWVTNKGLRCGTMLLWGDGNDGTPENAEPDEPELRWMFYARTYSQADKNAPLTTSNMWSVSVNHDGRYMYHASQDTSDLSCNGPEFEQNVLFPVLLVISLSQKPTNIIQVEPDAKLRAKAVKQWGQDLVVYREVKLPRQSVVYASGGAGTPRRLHFVSGHWKPSLGCYIHPYLRGDASLGFCVTSYKA